MSWCPFCDCEKCEKSNGQCKNMHCLTDKCLEVTGNEKRFVCEDFKERED